MMGVWLAVIFHSLILWCVYQATTTHEEVNKSFLAIKEGCVCPGHTFILECTVVTTATRGGTTVWNGTSFDCPSSNNVITLLNNKFLDTNTGESGKCDNGSVMAQILRIDPQADEDNSTYLITSQLNVTINSKILGQTITCQYDDGIGNISTIDSIKLTKKLTDQFNSSEVNYSMANNGSRTIMFTWNAFNTSKCPAIPYSILATGCGNCPTTTNHTTATCTNVPNDVTYCIFALIPAICGGISPRLSTLLEVKLKGSNEGRSDLIAACVILTIVVITLLILISIMLLFRFKDYIKRIFCFRFEIPVGRCSASLCTNQPREHEAQLQCHFISQYEEISIYSCVDKEDSDETNGSVLKIFDNKSKKGIYGIDDEYDHHEVECTACQPQVSSQTVNSLNKVSATNHSVSLNVEDLLKKLDDEVKSLWYKFGEAIGVPRDYLDTLSGEKSQCLKTILDHWLTHHPGQPSWDEVAKAQRKIKLLNQFELKDKAADHVVEDVPPPKPPRRRSSMNRSHSLSTAPTKISKEQQENFYT